MMFSQVRLILMISILLLVMSLPVQGNDEQVEHSDTVDVARMLTQLRSAVKEQPHNADLRARLHEMILVAGSERLKDRDYDGALEMFAEGRELAPDDSRFFLYSGVAWFRLGRHDDAEDELKTALRLGDDSATPLMLLGQVYYTTGRLYEAQQVLGEALERKPADAGARSLLAKVQRDLAAEQEMTTDYGAHFLIAYDDGVHGSVGEKVLDVLEGAYDNLGYLFDFYPETSVNVLLYARQDFLTLTGSPDWSGGLYDGKIRVPVGGVDRMTPKMEGVLYHEYSHVMIRYLTRGRCPTWLNEGLAVLAERKRFERPLSVLPVAAKAGTLLSFEQLEKSFTGLPEEQVLLAYEQSWSFVDFLLRRFEWFEMQRLLEKVGNGMGAADAVRAVYGKYGFDFGLLEREWQHEVGNSEF